MNIVKTNPLTLLRSALVATIAILVSHSGIAQTVLTSGEVDAAYSLQFEISPSPEDGSSWSASNLPDGLSINASTALINGIPTTVGVYDEITITLTRPDLTTDNFDVSITIEAATGTPEITSAATASGTVGEAFSYTVTASNSPESFNVDGDLPSGISFSEESLSGTPTVSGTFEISLSGNNGSGTGAVTVLTLTIDPAGAVPVINSSQTLSGDADELLSYQITATEEPSSYSASGLPLGLSIDTGSGFINGTPTIEGVFLVELTATNENGTSETFTLEIILGDVPQISSSLTLSATELIAIEDYQLSANNSPTSFTVSTDSLPDGLTYDSTTKKITGAPTESGTFSVEVYASNSVGDGSVSTILITVSAKTDVPDPRPAEYEVVREDGTVKLYLVFDQSVEDLDTYDWLIETSEDLESWNSVSLEDDSLQIEITNNQDGSKTVSVLYPDFDETEGVVFFRYRVAAQSE